MSDGIDHSKPKRQDRRVSWELVRPLFSGLPAERPEDWAVRQPMPPDAKLLVVLRMVADRGEDLAKASGLSASRYRKAERHLEDVGFKAAYHEAHCRFQDAGNRQARQAALDPRAARLAAARQLATHTKAEWQAMLDFCGRCCAKCQANRPHKDHIIPLRWGGSDGIENLQPLCLACNGAKGSARNGVDYRLPGWREWIAEALS